MKRKSNIEILRILSILLIISFHYVYKSGFVFEKLNLNSYIIKIFWMFGELGVNLFILITGYFMCKSNFSKKKLIKLILEVNFYYLFSLVIGTKLGVITITTKRDLLLQFFPTILNKYWFITAYVIVYILSPYINILIENLDKKEYQKLLVKILFIWCIIPTFFGAFFNSSESMLYYSRFIWFIIMYLVGAYIRIHSIKFLEKPRNSVIGTIILFGIMVISIGVIYKYKDIFVNIGLMEIAYFWTPNTIPMFLLSIFIFNIFIHLNIKPIPIINKIASTTLGIYMLHDGILTDYIWNKIFKNGEALSYNGLHSLEQIMLATLAIFIVGCIIDLIRQFIEKYTVNKILDSKFLQDKYTKISSKITK